MLMHRVSYPFDYAHKLLSLQSHMRHVHKRYIVHVPCRVFQDSMAPHARTDRTSRPNISSHTLVVYQEESVD